MKYRQVIARCVMILFIIHFSLFISYSQDTGSGSKVYHIYRERTEQGLRGAQILNGVESDQNIFRAGDTYIMDNKVYEILVVTALRFSGLVAHMYVWEYDPELTQEFIDLGIIIN